MLSHSASGFSVSHASGTFTVRPAMLRSGIWGVPLRCLLGCSLAIMPTVRTILSRSLQHHGRRLAALACSTARGRAMFVGGSPYELAAGCSLAPGLRTATVVHRLQATVQLMVTHQLERALAVRTPHLDESDVAALTTAIGSRWRHDSFSGDLRSPASLPDRPRLDLRVRA